MELNIRKCQCSFAPLQLCVLLEVRLIALFHKYFWIFETKTKLSLYKMNLESFKSVATRNQKLVYYAWQNLLLLNWSKNVKTRFQFGLRVRGLHCCADYSQVVVFLCHIMGIRHHTDKDVWKIKVFTVRFLTRYFSM